MKASLAIVTLLWACINSPAPRLVPMPPQEPNSVGWTEVAKRLTTADGVMVGTIRKIEADWAYDDPCGLVMILRHGCDGTVTYKLHIANDLHEKWLWAFTPAYGTFGLFVGERAVFIWHNTLTYRYQQCRQSQAITSSYCEYDFLDALTSDLDVLPPEDSARVTALFPH